MLLYHSFIDLLECVVRLFILGDFCEFRQSCLDISTNIRQIEWKDVEPLTKQIAVVVRSLTISVAFFRKKDANGKSLNKNNKNMLVAT